MVQGYRLRDVRMIRHSDDFKKIIGRGGRFQGRCMTIFVLPTRGMSRVGVVAGKRVGGAVRRNRAKRILREIFRLNAWKIGEGLDIVVVAKPQIICNSFMHSEIELLNIVNNARGSLPGKDSLSP